jgi:pimeloyl-ACP methyl ester carboxylesterase
VSRVVLVHGAFNELWGPNELAARWIPALRDGLWHHGVDIDPAEVAVCFYGDLFRRDPEHDDPDAVAAARAAVREQMGDLGHMPILDAVHHAHTEEIVDRTVDMAAVMGSTPDVADRMQERLAAVVGPDTQVVVGHSMGSVVAYRGLCARTDWPVATFVTVGSPLAGPLGALIGLGEERPAPWPGRVERWTNVAAVGDKVAGALAPVFGDRVVDHQVDNGRHAHRPETYLNTPVAGAAVAEGLGLLRP